ncbi:MAG: 30S ribosomal protein S4 [Kiritimatiellia bacterium]|nr:30S ribosomal protein S4 [Kiritimatiellia bacterium]MDP6848885.1 30S ribosomal protein S4 [Kiritimatiellia bacterium]
MGRYTGPSCKKCRREGMKLFLKGTRCYMAKCPIETGKPAPGMHGQRRSRKLSDYGVQLREKQRLRRQYGMQEKQFRLFFDRAAKRSGVTGEQLLQLLESRLDNVVYRLGFASSRKAARQLVLHNHVLLDGRQANIPSMMVGAGCTVQVKESKKSRELAAKGLEASDGRGVPTWMSLDAKNFQGAFVRIPTREEIAPNVDEQLVVELYSK